MLPTQVNSNIPPDFDWVAYRSLNKDLHYITNEKDALKHWKIHGHYQNRKYTLENRDNESLNHIVSVFGMDIVDEYRNKMNEVPKDFNWIAYKSLNNDLKNLYTYTDAVKHYKKHGYYQSRSYTFESNTNVQTEKASNNIYENLNIQQILEMSEINYGILNRQNGLPEDFDWHIYKSKNPDLSGIKTYNDAVKHYKEHGYMENRKYYNKDKPHTETLSSQNEPLQMQLSIQNHPSTQLQYHGENKKPTSTSTNFDCKRIDKQEIPKDFEWLSYKKLNPDLLNINSYLDAIMHYREHGWRENRKYKLEKETEILDTHMEKVHVDYDWVDFRARPKKAIRTTTEVLNIEIPKDFDWKAYKLLNTDLTNINGYSDAVRHYRDHGYREQRSYKFVQNIIDKTQVITKNAESYHLVPNICDIVETKHKKEILVPKKPIIRYQGIQHNVNIKQTSNIPLTSKQPTIRPPTFKPPTIIPQTIKPPTIKPPTKKPQTVKPPPTIKSATIKPYVNKPQIKLKQYISNGKNGVGCIGIPNIIHFIYGFKEQKNEFELFRYLSIMSAYHLNHPDNIYFYYKYEPFGYLWERVKPFLTLVQMEPPETVYGKKLRGYAHQADIVRLNVLNEKGGIYLDIDTITLRPMTELLVNEFVMGIQGENYGLCNAIMLCKANTEFGHSWMKSYESYNGQWDTHSVVLPYKLSKIYPITVLPNDAFFYPLWDNFMDYVLSENINYDCCNRILSKSYCLHLWELENENILRNINEQNIFEQNTLYNIIARKFIKNHITIIMILSNIPDNIVEMIGSFYKILSKDIIHECIIYYNGCELNTENQRYSDNLSNINPKFKVNVQQIKQNTSEIKKHLCEDIKSGIIFYTNNMIHIKNENIMEKLTNYLYDESIGMIGIAGRNDNESSKFVDEIYGLQVFRSEIFSYGIKIDTNNFDDDMEFSKRIKNLGKKLLIIND